MLTSISICNLILHEKPQSSTDTNREVHEMPSEDKTQITQQNILETYVRLCVFVITSTNKTISPLSQKVPQIT